MTRFMVRFVAIISLVFMSQLAHAQMTIIQYFEIKDDFKLDLTNKKNLKTIFTKGVLDVEYNPDKRVLAVSYDPKEADIALIIKHINKCAGEDILTDANTKTKAQ
jgi:copper chaperone CopZ